MQRSTEDERDHLVKDLLFAMASHSSQQTRKLDTLNTKDICSQSLNTFNPQTSTSSRGQAIKRRPKTGMSLINPNSKLSKTQKGIAFD